MFLFAKATSLGSGVIKMGNGSFSKINDHKRRRGNSPWIAPALLTKYLSTTEHEEGQVADSTHLCPQPLYL